MCQQHYQEFLFVPNFLTLFNDFPQNVLNMSLRKELRILFSVLMGELISLQYQKSVVQQANGLPDPEVSGLVVKPIHRIFMLSAL